MTEAQPEHIKANPIYRRVWNLITVQDMNACFLVLGDVGKGKSTAAIRMASDLDKDFSVERIVFSAEDFFKLVAEGDSKGKLRAGSAIIFDEAAGSEESMDSRQSLTHTNKTLSWFTTISRAKQLIIFYVCPFLSQLDKRLRLIGLTGIILLNGIDRKQKRSRANFYWTYGAPLSDRVLMPKPRFKDAETGEIFAVPYITLPMPADKELLQEYKAKKNAFIDSKISDWRKSIAEHKNRKASETVNLKKYYDKAIGRLDDYKSKEGIISVSVIRVKTGLSEKHAKELKVALEAYKP